MDPQTLLTLSVLLGVITPCLTISPRLSFPLDSPGRPVTTFYTPDVSNTTTLLLSDDADTLFVGARDAVLSLDVSQQDAIVLRGQLDWAPLDKDLDDCSMKGKDKADCPNFIRVLQFLNSTHIYACGTYAFSPRCTYINTESFSLMTGPKGRPEEGKGRCPYDPYQRNTAIIVDGELYTGTVADYRGNRPVISRHLSEGSRVDLKLDDTLGWLEDPTFISSSFLPSEDKIYFFFSEVGREYDFIEKFTVSRIAQVCTTDVGGQRTLQRRWTTFAKALLLCQDDGQLPYSVLQDMFTLPPPEGGDADDTLFYGVFSSQWSTTSGRSAVCTFRLGDIKSVFAGNYKVLNRDTLRWSTRVQEKIANPGECGLHNASDNTLRFIKENFLADDSVRSLGQSLTLRSDEHLYTHLAVQRVPAVNGRDYTVLFLLTESGFLHKVVLLEKGAHIVEEIQVLRGSQSVKNMLLSLAKGVVIVGSSEGVVRVPVANCSLSQSCAECVLAQDPFCAWDPANAVCVDASTRPANAAQDVDTGNVHETCKTLPFTPRSRFGQKLPTGELVSVSLNEVVRLECPEASLLARRHWERPSSRLDPRIYLQLQDGSLTFLASPVTLGHYLCLSTENGFQQTLAVYQVKQKTSTTPQPTSTPPPSHSHKPALPSPAATTEQATSSSTPSHPGPTEVELRKPSPTLLPTQTVVSTGHTSRNLSLWLDRAEPPAPPGGDQLLLARGQTYLKELVVVSVLLALCVSLLLTVGLYQMKHRCRWRTAPQVSPGRDSERGAEHEREALRGGQSPHGPDKQNGKANGTLSNGTPKGSNGHLPNIPM